MADPTTFDPQAFESADAHGLRARKHWALEPGCVFLNHGSFGAAPRCVLAEQQRWRDRMERQPVRFMTRELPEAVRRSADALAGFLGTTGDRVALVDNATSAINAVLRALHFKADDEILITDHAYGAVRNAAQFACHRSGARLVEAAVPFPIAGGDEVTAAVAAAITPHTRLAILDHVTSSTAIAFPLPALIQVCRRHHVLTLIDAAHAPGMLPVALDRLDADFCAGNCHKWMMTPKGCGFLWARPDWHERIKPLIVSWGIDQGFPRSFDWPGTRDLTAWLSLPAAIEFLGELGGPTLMERNHLLVLLAAQHLAREWNVSRPAPDAMLGAMATLPLPGRATGDQKRADAIHDRVLQRHNVEANFMSRGDRLWVRVSAQAYNTPDDYSALARAVQTVLAT